jgi:hypothetical protein
MTTPISFPLPLRSRFTDFDLCLPRSTINGALVLGCALVAVAFVASDTLAINASYEEQHDSIGVAKRVQHNRSGDMHQELIDEA